MSGGLFRQSCRCSRVPQDFVSARLTRVMAVAIQAVGALYRQEPPVSSNPRHRTRQVQHSGEEWPTRQWRPTDRSQHCRGGEASSTCALFYRRVPERLDVPRLPRCRGNQRLRGCQPPRPGLSVAYCGTRRIPVDGHPDQKAVSDSESRQLWPGEPGWRCAKA